MRKVWAELALALVFIFMAVAPASAFEIRSGTVIHIQQGETVNDDLTVAGESLTIDGTVNGDVWTSANTVFVNGTINGNLFTAARTLEVNGTVTGTIVSLADRILVTGRVERSLVAAGSRVALAPGGSVGHSFAGAGDHVDIQGAVGRGAVVGATRATVAGSIGKEVWAGVEKLEITSTAEIRGPVTYWSEDEAQIAEGARVGEVTHRRENYQWRFETMPWFMKPWHIALKFAGFILVGLVVLSLFPGLRRSFPERIYAKPWQAPLAGFLALIAMPVAAILLMFTVVGIPLGITTLLALPLLIYFGQVLVSWTVGRFLADRIDGLKNLHWFVLFLIGSLATTVMIELPVIGFILGTAAVFYGLGGFYFALTHREETL